MTIFLDKLSMKLQSRSSRLIKHAIQYMELHIALSDAEIIAEFRDELMKTGMDKLPSSTIATEDPKVTPQSEKDAASAGRQCHEDM